MTDSAVKYEQGRRRDRRPHPRRPDRQRQHHERPLQGLDARGRRPAVRREGRRHRCGDHLGQEDLLRRRQPQGHAGRHSRRRPGGLRDVRGHQGRPAPARDARQAGRRRDQRRRARRRPRDHARLPPPDRRRRRQGRARPARGDPRPAARRRRRHPHRADVRHPVRADGHPAPGHPLQAGGGQGEGPRRRAGRQPRRPRARPRRSGSTTTRTTRRPRRTRGTATATRSPAAARRAPSLAAFLPAFPAMLRKQTKGARLPGPAGDHGRGDRGRAGRLRHREPDRVALPRRADHRVEQQEHDPGVLLRPVRDQLRAAASRRTCRSSRPPRSACSVPG